MKYWFWTRFWKIGKTMLLSEKLTLSKRKFFKKAQESTEDF